jgi:hypothetical protein
MVVTTYITIKSINHTGKGIIETAPFTAVLLYPMQDND